MQKFTRPLTREIEVGGERLALTLSEEGLTIRPVGSRRPPVSLSWAACLCAATGQQTTGGEATPEQVTGALEQLRSGGASSTKGAERVTSAPRQKSSLDDLLARVDQWFARHRKRFYPALLDGASDEEIQPLEEVLGQPVPEELRTWLRWHNGQNADIIGAFEGGWYLMSVQQIVETKKELDANSLERRPPLREGVWKKSFVPFLDDDRDSFLVLDLDQAGPPVLECWRATEETPVAAPSLTAWVQQFLEGLEAGAYSEDPERGDFYRV